MHREGGTCFEESVDATVEEQEVDKEEDDVDAPVSTDVSCSGEGVESSCIKLRVYTCAGQRSERGAGAAQAMVRRNSGFGSAKGGDLSVEEGETATISVRFAPRSLFNESAMMLPHGGAVLPAPKGLPPRRLLLRLREP